MRNAKGQFIKGYHASPETEFKPGTHWRPPKPFWNHDWLYAEYVTKRHSAKEIATRFGVTENAILYWLKKHSIPTRSMQEIRAQKYWGLSGERNPMYGKRGAEVPNWKGGCTPDRQAFYSSEEWAKASLAVWKRDTATCQRCGTRAVGKNGAMHIHHIVSFAVKELRADINNLVLLCIGCHHWVHSRENTEQDYIKEVPTSGVA